MRTLEKVSRIKYLRLGKGLTQEQLAAKTGGLVSQAQISQIEGGRRPRDD
jgi:transcriptional regulator with XRE-family HTH domain